jgi:hypothetical protein
VFSIRNETRCGSVDIRNDPKQFFLNAESKQNLFDYKRCTIIEGDVTLAIIGHNRNASLSITDEHFPVFDNLREITGSLLVYGVK